MWLLTQGDHHFSWLDTGEPTDEEEEEEASDEDGPSEDRASPYEAISVDSEVRFPRFIYILIILTFNISF